MRPSDAIPEGCNSPSSSRSSSCPMSSNDKQLFGLYSIGLAVGFFGYLIVYVILNGRKEAGTIMGQGDTPIELNE